MLATSQPRKLVLIFGTRPEAIKLAPVYLELRRRPDRFVPRLWVTAQHRQMLDQVLDAFELTPDRDFDLMRPGQTLTQVTARVLEILEAAFAVERPDMVIVQGDTTTMFAAALAAFYAGIRVGHVEAGLRTWDRHAPYPEEINRQLGTRLSDLHFAPTETARANLLAEQVPTDCIHVTGNTVIDALEIASRKVHAHPPELPGDFPTDRLADGRPMVLITGHRRESFGAGFEAICRAVAELARRHPGIEWVYPVHLNPNVRGPVGQRLGGRPNIHLIEPLAYKPFVYAMGRCRLLLSDSGGVQEEAPHLGKPVLVLRETTERPEGIAAGTCRLVGTDAERIVTETTRLLTDEAAYEAMSRSVNPYGDGQAAGRITEALATFFEQPR